MNKYFKYLFLFIFWCVLGTLSYKGTGMVVDTIYNKGVAHMEKKAIENNVGYYDPKTKEFKWIRQVENK